jgi:hypothetical protein
MKAVVEFDLKLALLDLEITQRECAEYLKVNDRTVRRWIAKKMIPVTAMYAISAWIKLKGYGVAWRPQEIDIMPVNVDYLKENAKHEMNRILALKQIFMNNS